MTACYQVCAFKIKLERNNNNVTFYDSDTSTKLKAVNYLPL